MPTLLRGRHARPLAGLTAAVLTAGGLLAIAGAPSQAVTPAPTLTWLVSQQFHDAIPSHVMSGGATEDADGITFVNGTGTRDAGTGATSLAYAGTVAASFNHPSTGAPLYSLTIADPAVSIDADGHGTLTAVVSSSVTGSDHTDPTRVTVVTFDADDSDWTIGGGLASLTETPHWTGVLPEGPASVALGIGAGKPVDGGAFDPAFLAQLAPGVRAHFYASGAGSDSKKVAAPVTLQAALPTPAVTYTTTSASHADGLRLSVSGTDFTGVTNPGDDGVYAGLAPAGGMPDVSDMANMSLFAGVNRVPASGITGGAFTTSISAPTAKLDPTKSYSIYTWQAHAHSNEGQDTETPVIIDWSKLAAPTPPPATKATPAVSLDWAKKPVVGKKAKLTIGVTGTGATPSGQVTVTLDRKGANKAKTLTGTLAGGSVELKLPKLSAGKWTVTIVYAGDTAFTSAQVSEKVKVQPKKK